MNKYFLRILGFTVEALESRRTLSTFIHEIPLTLRSFLNIVASSSKSFHWRSFREKAHSKARPKAFVEEKARPELLVIWFQGQPTFETFHCMSMSYENSLTQRYPTKLNEKSVSGNEDSSWIIRLSETSICPFSIYHALQSLIKPKAKIMWYEILKQEMRFRLDVIWTTKEIQSMNI